MDERKMLAVLQCSTCGHNLCCRKFKVLLTDEEYETGFYLVDEEPLWMYTLKRENGKCVYLSACGRCSIYDVRPEACRKYSCAGDLRFVES